MTARTTRRRQGLAALVASVAIAIAAVTLVVPAAGAADRSSGHGHEHAARTSAESFRQDMRKLWEDHITWTRLYIVAAEAGLPDTAATAGRLLRNQDDIGAAIAAFYGADAGAQLTALLREHILTAAALIDAAERGDAAAVASTKASWYDNADRIGAFLAAANPRFWPVATMKAMMRQHLDLTLAEAVHHLQGDFTADIADYDQVHVHILGMADALADGIIAQLPARFDH